MHAVHQSETAHSSVLGVGLRTQVIPYVDKLSAIERHTFESTIRGQYGQPGIPRLSYEGYIKAFAHPDAVRYIEGLLAQPG
jgi:hypothetical protein